MERLTRLSLASPRAALGLLLVTTILLGLGLPHVHSKHGYRVVIGDDHPAIRTLDAFTERFGGGLPIQIAWACGPGLPCEDPLDEQSIGVARALEEALAETAGVRTVIGPASAPLLVPVDGGFSIRHLVEHGERPADAGRLAAAALRDPLWVGRIVSKDRRAAAVVVQPSDSREETGIGIAAAIEAALAPHEAAGFRFHGIGDAIENLIVGEDLDESMHRLIPFTVLLIGLVLLLLCRSIQHTLASLATMGLALLWTFGLLGWLRLPQDGILQALAPLVLVVGICDAVHLLSRLAPPGARETDLAERRARMIEVAREIGPACTVTSLTTAIAFASFATSDLATFVRFGSISAFGVLACLVLTFSLLPILAVAIPAAPQSARRTADAWRVSLEAILRTSERRAGSLLLASLAALVFCLVGWIAFLRVDTNWVETLGEHSRVVRAQRFMEEHFGQTSSLEMELELPPGTLLEDPATLREIQTLTDFLSGLEGIERTRSIVDVVARVNRLLHGNRAASATPGATFAANAEILELIELDDPGLLARWVSFDRRKVRVSATAPEQPSSARGRVLAAARGYAENRLPAGWRYEATGRIAIQFEWIRDVQITQLRSFPTALLLVFAMVAIFLRSIPLACAAMVPTVLPIVVTLGAMGWVGMTLDVGRSMIAAVLLGIAVDDSIHVLRHYAERRRAGEDSRAAIRGAVLHTGRAVVTTSCALSLGFLTLMASAWQSIASFGFFVAVAILGALAASLFLLPAIIFAFSRRTNGSDEVRGLPSDDVPATRTRRLAGAAALLPLCVVLVGAGVVAVETGPSWEPPCWILPSGHVLGAPGPPASCPLGLADEIRWIEPAAGVRQRTEGDAAGALRSAAEAYGPIQHVRVSRGGESRRVAIEMRLVSRAERLIRLLVVGLLASALMAIPVLLLWRSRSPAAAPLCVFYAAIGVVLLASTAGRQSEWLGRAGLLALVVAPAALMHLSLVFPEEARAARIAPRLPLVPYLGSVLLAIAGALTLARNPVLWPSFIDLQLLLSALGWAIVICSCAHAMRESTSPLHRARSRFVLLGGLALPAVVATPFAWRAALADAAVVYLWTAALLMPLPIAVAISRYNLFDLGWHVRHGIARIAYCACGAFAAALLVAPGLRWLEPISAAREPVVLLGFAFGCVLVAEALRRPVLAFLEARILPRSEQLLNLRRESASTMLELRDEEAIAESLLHLLAAGLSPSRAWVVLHRGDQVAATAALGSEPLPDRRRVLPAAASLAAAPPLQLVRGASGLEGPHRDLLRSDIRVLAAIELADERFGMVLLGDDPRNEGYARAELDFLRDVTAHAAAALHSARLAERYAARERDATIARVAVELMHDVGKDLGWIRRLVRRLEDAPEIDSTRRDQIARVQELTESVVRRMRAFVRDATEPRVDAPGIARVDEIVERSLRTARARHGGERLRLSNDPSTRGVRCHENVGRALSHLVETGIRASEGDRPLRVSAHVEGAWLRISVGDGSGVALRSGDRMAERAREIVEALGGGLGLSHRPRLGPCATLRIPINEERRPT